MKASSPAPFLLWRDWRHNFHFGKFVHSRNPESGSAMMRPESSQIAHVLSEKFEILHQAFIELNSEAADYQRELNLSDKTSREQFDALSRTLAFCDQMHMVLTLMREDLRALEPRTSCSEILPWSDQLDDCIEEWLRNACLTNPTVH
jgi:hypothetical protein